MNSHIGHVIKDYEEEDVKLALWDVRISNFCNFKCRGCGHLLSSAWYEDALILENIPGQGPIRSGNKALITLDDKDNFFNDLENLSSINNSTNIAFDILKYDNNKYEIRVALAGVNKDQVSIIQFNDCLTLEVKAQKIFAQNAAIGNRMSITNKLALSAPFLLKLSFFSFVIETGFFSGQQKGAAK